MPRPGVGWVLGLVGCAGGAGGDGAAGDTAGPSTSDEAPALSYVSLDADCSDDDVCFWNAQVDGVAGSVDLYLADTSGAAEAWSEHHWLFVDLGGGHFQIALDLVDAADQYQDNLTTRFDMERDVGITSWLLFVKDPAGAVADCATGGADPAHWESTCP